MKKYLLIIFSIIASTMVVSCDDNTIGDEFEPISWEIVSTSGNIKVSINKEIVDVYCGPEECALCLICASENKSERFFFYPKFDFEKENCNFDKYGMVGFDNGLSKVTADPETGTLRIELPPYSEDDETEFKFEVTSGILNYTRLTIHRQP